MLRGGRGWAGLGDSTLPERSKERCRADAGGPCSGLWKRTAIDTFQHGTARTPGPGSRRAHTITIPIPTTITTPGECPPTRRGTCNAAIPPFVKTLPHECGRRSRGGYAWGIAPGP